MKFSCSVTAASRPSTSSCRFVFDSLTIGSPAATTVPSSTRTSSTRPPSTASRYTVLRGTSRPRSGMKSSNVPTVTSETAMRCELTLRLRPASSVLTSHAANNSTSKPAIPIITLRLAGVFFATRRSMPWPEIDPRLSCCASLRFEILFTVVPVVFAKALCPVDSNSRANLISA